MLVDFERSTIQQAARQPLSPTVSNLKRTRSGSAVSDGRKHSAALNGHSSLDL